MRLLHTADWHLGRRTLREPRAADHDAVIAEIVRVARDVRPDVVLHAGDLWDSARPGHDDLLRGVEALRELSAIAPVHVVCGNHDSPSLFRALGRLPGVAEHVTFAADSDAPLSIVPLAEGGRALVASVPYLHPNRSGDRASAGEAYREDLRRHLAAAAERLAREAGPGDRRIVVAHLHVAGAQLSSTAPAAAAERAEAHCADSAALPPVDYVALGHIHRPQAVADNARYAGSPLALDFGEADDPSSVTLVSADRSGAVRAEEIPLAAGRRLVTVECGEDELARHAAATAGALCRAVVHTGDAAPGLADRVRAAWPEARVLDIVTAGPAPAPTDPARRPGAVAVEDLLRDHLAREGVHGVDLDRLMARFRTLSEDVEHGRAHDPAELRALPGVDPAPPEPAPEGARQTAGAPS